MNRFDRTYLLNVTLTTGEVLQIKDMRIGFDVTKSISGGLNDSKIQIYNLNQAHREALIKDKNDKTKKMPLSLYVGYGPSLKKIFVGDITEAKSIRQGSDFITVIDSEDGGYDYRNGFTSKVVKTRYLESIINDLPNTEKGKITKQLVYIRPKVLVGNSYKIIEKSLAEDETMFIDNNTLHIIKENEVVSDYVPVVTSSSGLLNIPIKTEDKVIFETMMNPELRIGGLLSLVSLYSPKLNGLYKVESINYKGDNYGTEWSMELITSLAKDYKVL